MPEDDASSTQPATYHDDDLVYVDPTSKTVVGKVEFSNAGRPKPLLMPRDQKDDEGAEQTKRAPRKQRYYPWGTYRSMKHVYKIEGKQPKVESQQTLDDAIAKALTAPFWD